MTKKTPVHTIDAYWPVEVAIFENEDGNGRKHYSVAPTVSYKDDRGWQSGHSYNETVGDSYRLMQALQDAHQWVGQKRKANHLATRSAAPSEGG